MLLEQANYIQPLMCDNFRGEPFETGFDTTYVVYFNQLLGGCSTQKLIETFFSTFSDHFKDKFEVPPQGTNQLLHFNQL